MKKMKVPRGTARARRRRDMVSFNKERNERLEAERKLRETVTISVVFTKSAGQR